MSAATLDFGVPLHSTFGAMLIGVIVSAVLHGICLLQAFFYFSSYPKDNWIIKGMVITTCSFDFIHLCMVTHAMYYYLVSGFGNENTLHRLVWSILMEALMTGLNAAMVQAFYTYRVWTLSKKNYVLCCVILFLIGCTATCGTAWVVLSMRFKTFQQLLTISPLTITINALSCTVDVIIAASLCWMLHQSRTGFRRSDTIINKLMVFVVNTGMLTTACAIASLICLVASPHTLIYATFYFCIGRFYTNSFIATLNARKSISGSNVNTQENTGSTLVMSIPRSVSAQKVPAQDIAIRIETTRQAVEDTDDMRKTPLEARAQTDESVSDVTSQHSTRDKI